MFNRLRLLAFFLIVFLPLQLFGIFYKVVEYRNATQPDKKIYAVHEFHAGYRSSIDQLNRLLDWCKNYKLLEGESPLIIAEDVWQPPHDKEYEAYIEYDKKQYYDMIEYAQKMGEDTVLPLTSMLCGLVKHCTTEGLDSITGDFRKNIGRLYSKDATLKKELVFEEITQQITMLGNQAVSEKTKKMYLTFIESFLDKNNAIMAALGDTTTPIGALYKMMPMDCNFATELVDAGILHHLVANKERKKIVVCFGGAHLENIHAAIIELGYEMVSCVGPSSQTILEESIQAGKTSDDDNSLKRHIVTKYALDSKVFFSSIVDKATPSITTSKQAFPPYTSRSDEYDSLPFVSSKKSFEVPLPMQSTSGLLASTYADIDRYFPKII